MITTKYLGSRVKFSIALGCVISIIFVIGISKFTKLVTAGSIAGQSEERTWDIDEEFPDGVLKVEEVKHIDSKKFYKDMTVRITNIGSKPIYYILVYVLFPESKKVIGGTIAISMTYGENRDLITVGKGKPKDTDKPINPGESVVLQMDKGPGKGLERNIESGSVPPDALKKVRFFFQAINFGDETGYYGKQFVPKKSSLNKVSANDLNQRNSGTVQKSFSKNSFLPTNTGNAIATTQGQNCYSSVEAPFACAQWELVPGVPCCSTTSDCGVSNPQAASSGPTTKVCSIYYCCGDESCGPPVAGFLLKCKTHTLRSCGGSQGGIAC